MFSSSFSYVKKSNFLYIKLKKYEKVTWKTWKFYLPSKLFKVKICGKEKQWSFLYLVQTFGKDITTWSWKILWQRCFSSLLANDTHSSTSSSVTGSRIPSLSALTGSGCLSRSPTFFTYVDGVPIWSQLGSSLSGRTLNLKLAFCFILKTFKSQSNVIPGECNNWIAKDFQGR